jgi:hypothetical protein
MKRGGSHGSPFERAVDANLGHIVPRDREGVSSVIASEAKQSIAPHKNKQGWLASSLRSSQ